MAAGESNVAELLIKAHADFSKELREFYENEAKLRNVLRPLLDKNIDETAEFSSSKFGIASSSKSKFSRSSTAQPTPRKPVLHGIRYELRRFHDRGGMGEIWLGQDQRIGREVAIKILRPERTELQERFQFEAQVSGQLEHPGVVRVYDCDVDSEGRPFYVMQFIRGKTLKEAIATCYEANVPDLDFHRLIQTMVDLCQIIAYAHSRGVVHRDLKPVNVMLGAFGETLVLDWGLAKLNDHPDSKAHLHQIRSSGSGLTETQDGAVLGSPQYLSPEAALGRVEEVDQYSDIYLLGATLYEILTGRPPRHGTSAIETVELARKSEPPFPRTLRSSVPKPLDAICRKAMARNKNDRYGSASDMASDLQRFLAHEPVSVYSENLAERFCAG